MRHSIFLCLLALSLFAPPPPHLKAQGSTVPVNTGFELSGQMYSLGTYFNVPTQTSIYTTGTRVIDTGVNTTALNLYVAKLGKGKVNADTFLVEKLNGKASALSLICPLLKCTGSPTVTATPVESQDGINYAPIPGVAVQTLVPTSLTVPVYAVFNLTSKPAPYLGIQFGGSASSTYSAQALWWLIKDQVIQLPDK